jgi:hypothetical protein
MSESFDRECTAVGAVFLFTASPHSVNIIGIMRTSSSGNVPVRGVPAPRARQCQRYLINRTPRNVLL